MPVRAGQLDYQILRRASRISSRSPSTVKAEARSAIRAFHTRSANAKA